MREILFKAKRIDNGEWVEGNYVKKYDLLGKKHLILYVDNYVRWEYAEIIPETLCQFTGRLTRTVRGSGRTMLFGLFMMGKNIFIR